MNKILFLSAIVLATIVLSASDETVSSCQQSCINRYYFYYDDCYVASQNGWIDYEECCAIINDLIAECVVTQCDDL